MSKPILASLVLLGCLSATARAQADDAPVPASDPPTGTAVAAERPADAEPEDLRTVYLSFSPLHLLIGPIGEGQMELRAHRNVGVAAIFGAGSMEYDGYKFGVWEVGGQLVGYPIGTFDHGMQLGVEALYAHVSVTDDLPKNVDVATGSGLAVSPLIGYKWASSIGFTLNVQGGVSFMAIQADASDDSGHTAKATANRIGPLFNFNVGWSI